VAAAVLVVVGAKRVERTAGWRSLFAGAIR